MGIKITGNVSAALKRMSGNVSSLPMDKVGAYAVQEIVARTEQGLDMDMRRFEPYHLPERRIKGGRQSTRVDLNWSGNMLAAMRHEATDKTAKIYFGSMDIENAKAHGHHNGSKTLPQRKFFGLDAGLITRINERFRKWILS